MREVSIPATKVHLGSNGSDKAKRILNISRFNLKEFSAAKYIEGYIRRPKTGEAIFMRSLEISKNKANFYFGHGSMPALWPWCPDKQKPHLSEYEFEGTAFFAITPEDEWGEKMDEIFATAATVAWRNRWLAKKAI